MLYHDRDLEEDCILKLAQIQARDLLDFLQPVYQSVSMDVELARRLRNVEIVLKEAIDRVERVLIKRLDGVS